MQEIDWRIQNGEIAPDKIDFVKMVENKRLMP